MAGSGTFELGVLTRAQAGDEQAFAELVSPYRRELQLHCYRMLGSVSDADDLLQETMVAAWQGLSGLAGRSTLRAWLFRIATNRCLNSIRSGRRRPLPTPVPPFEPPEPTRRGAVSWLQPYPDAWLDLTPDPAPDPAARYEQRESVELAFIAALQLLPPRQIAVLVLSDVLGFSLREVATMLDATPTASKGLLQRARAALRRESLGGIDRPPEPGSRAEADLAQRFANAFSADDVESLVALLTDDAWLAMPPAPHEYHGIEPIAAFLRASAVGRAGQRLQLRPTRANGQPAFACYLGDADSHGAQPSGLIVLTLAGDRITGVTRFLDPKLPAVFGFGHSWSEAASAGRPARRHPGAAAVPFTLPNCEVEVEESTPMGSPRRR